MQQAIKHNETQYSYLIRVVAILLVIIDHCTAWYSAEDIDWKICVYVFGCDSLLFFLVSGAHNLPVTDTRRFYLRRLRIVGIPTILFTILYAFLDRYVAGPEPARTAYRFLLDVPFYLPQDWLWYMYVLGGLYLIAPFISQVILNGKKRLIEFFLCLWLFTGYFPYIEAFFGRQMPVENVFYPFCGYLGYMLAGWYLLCYPFRTWSMAHKMSVMSLLVFNALLPLAISHTTIDSYCTLHGVYKCNLTACIMSLTLIVFILLQQVETLGRRADKVVKFIAKTSFAMYLLHYLVANYVSMPMIDSGYLTPFTATLTTLAVTTLAAIPLRYLIK